MAVDEPATANGVGDAPIADVFEQHGREVFRAAYRITGNVADAEDVLQTVFLKACRRTRKDPGERRFGDDPGRYLARAAVNGALDLLRARRFGQVADAVDLDAMPDPVGADADADVQRDRLRKRLRAALSTLAPNWAEIVALRYFEDLSNVEIAALLGTSASAVGVTLHRARARLRTALADIPCADL